MVGVQQYEGRGGDGTDAPRVDADVAECSEGLFQQGVAAFADRADAGAGWVEVLLLVGQLAAYLGVGAYPAVVSCSRPVARRSSRLASHVRARGRARRTGRLVR